MARSRIRAVAVALVALAIMLAAASPLRDADSRPFTAADLPSGSEARAAAVIASAGQRRGHGTAARPAPAPASGQSLFPKLPIAAGVSAVALLLVLLATFRSFRAVPVAIVSLLPAAAACGLAVLVLDQGDLASLIGLEGQGALETGAVASLLAGIAAVSATRSVTSFQAARRERELGLEPERAAGAASALTVPPAAIATVIAGGATAVLAGVDIYSAREFGLAVAAGLLIDLVVLRLPLIASLARWGGG